MVWSVAACSCSARWHRLEFMLGFVYCSLYSFLLNAETRRRQAIMLLLTTLPMLNRRALVIVASLRSEGYQKRVATMLGPLKHLIVLALSG